MHLITPFLPAMRLRGAFFILLASAIAALAVEGTAVSIHHQSTSDPRLPLFGQIIRYDISGSKVLRRAVIADLEARSPAINREGTLVAFLKKDGWLSITGIRGGEVRDLARAGDDVNSIDWPEGRWIYFTQGDCSTAGSATLSRIHSETRISERILVFSSNTDSFSRPWPWIRSTGSASLNGKLSFSDLPAHFSELGARRLGICPSFYQALSFEGQYGCSLAGRNRSELMIWSSRTHEEIARLRCTDLDICGDKGTCCVIGKVRWSSNSQDWLALIQTWNGKIEDGSNLVIQNWASRQKLLISNNVRGSGNYEVDGDFRIHEGPRVTVMPPELEFIIPQFGSATVFTKTASISNGSDGALPQLSVSTSQPSPWLSARISGSGENRTLLVRIDKRALSAGNNVADLAIRGRGVTSARIRVTAKISARNLPFEPGIEEISASSPNKIRVRFSCEPDQALRDISRYRISDELAIQNVIPGATEKSLVLVTSTPMVPDHTYQLQIQKFHCGSMHPDSSTTVAAEFMLESTETERMKGIVSQYLFDESKGNTITDAASADRSSDLVIQSNSSMPLRNGVLTFTGKETAMTGFSRQLSKSWNLTHELSIELWAKTADQKMTTTEGAILTVSDTFDSPALQLIQKNSSLVLQSGESGKERLLLPGVVGKKPLHVFLSIDAAGNTSVYVNGTPARTMQFTTASLFKSDKPLRLSLGGHPGRRLAWEGDIHSLNIWNRALSKEEVGKQFANAPRSVLTALRQLDMSTIAIPRKDIPSGIRIKIKYDVNGDMLVTVPVNEPHTAELVGVDGKVIATYQGNTAREYTFARAPLAAGIYMIRVSIGRKIVSRMVIVP